MCYFPIVVAGILLIAQGVIASPENTFQAQDLTPQQCAEVVVVIDVLKIHSATPFCSSFLGIQPTTTTAVFTVKTTSTSIKTTTVTSGTASTSIVFEPGSPPATTPKARVRRSPIDTAADVAQAMVKRDGVPTYLTSIASSVISSACDCLSIPTPTSTVTKTLTSKVSSVTTKTVTTAPKVVLSTFYPCATPIPTDIPTIPYGVSNGVGFVGADGNMLYSLDTAIGASAESCCNACYFELPYCIQAYWYFYEGCVVDSAATVNSTGSGFSTACPSGSIEGLTYSPDTNPPFRSTGSFAGPCGQTYNDLP